MVSELPIQVSRALLRSLYWSFAIVLVGTIWANFSVVKVRSSSMSPSYCPGDWLLIQKNRSLVERPGEIIVFRDHTDRLMVKRIVAVAGQRIRTDSNLAIVNGIEVIETYLCGESKSQIRSKEHALSQLAEMTIGPGRLFVMGDNRMLSTDSRDFGPIEIEQVVGRVVSAWNGFSRPRACECRT